MKSWLGLMLTVSCVLFSFALLAAPIPLTSSSPFISLQKGLFQSPLGFRLHSGQTGWEQIPPPKQNTFIETIYRAPGDNNVQAALTVRVDKTDKKYELSDYAQTWLKDYPRLGFSILTSKKVRVGQEVGYMLDLVNRDNAKQLRQVIFLKERHVVTLTCRDDMTSFQKTLKSCNDIIRTFQW